MQALFEIDPDSKTPKYIQVVDAIIAAVKRGRLKKGDRIFSINDLSSEYLLSRDTVQKAYAVLEEKGIISPIKGKGFYINRTDITTPYRILLLFNKISNYKKQIYNSFVETIGHNAIVDLKIHHSNAKVLESLLAEHMHEYDYYIIMPHFYENTDEACRLIQTIPLDKLLILDKDLTYVNKKYAAVYQDFQHDIVDALETGLDALKKYNKLILAYPRIIPYPREIVIGFRNFCMQNNFPYKITDEIKPDTEVCKGECYIVIEEPDLVNLIKSCRLRKLKVGKEIGIISYNETPLKEILLDGITVLSTDHAKMGETAAMLILENKKEKVKNPFTLIKRKSL